MAESKVVGRRLAFWKGTSQFWLVFTFVICPLCVILSVRYFAGLRHVDHLFDHFGDYLVPSALAAVGILMGPVGLVTLQSLRRAYVIVSACPACGFEATRDFGKADSKNPWPVPCGHCLAYLRVNPTKLVVRELATNTETDHLSHYGIVREQYEGVVSRRDDGDRQFNFAMPAMCAICCAGEAPFVSEIGVGGGSPDWGVTRALFWEPYNNPERKLNAPMREDEIERALKHVQTPACAQHKGKIAVERTTLGALFFTTYRYYKEFCALNKITEGPEVAFARAQSEVPQAVARVGGDSSNRSAS
jgi:hypothetical protein